MKEKTTLYHVNTIAKVDYVLKEEKLLISEHKSDNKYAGYGMYFWDNRGNADYWLGEKLSYEDKENLCLLVVSVEYENGNLLDLMDSLQEKEYARILDSLNKSGKFKGSTLGEKVDFLCEQLGFKIVRFGSYYPKTPQTALLKRSRVTNRTKVIYCIKNPHYDIIKEKQKEEFS